MDMDNPPAEEEQGDKMDTDEKEEHVVEDGEAKEKKKKRVKKEEEPHFEVLSNLSRVLPGQLKYVSFPEGSRYAPVKKVYSQRIALTVAYWWCFDHERFEIG